MSLLETIIAEHRGETTGLLEGAICVDVFAGGVTVSADDGTDQTSFGMTNAEVLAFMRMDPDLAEQTRVHLIVAAQLPGLGLTPMLDSLLHEAFEQVALGGGSDDPAIAQARTHRSRIEKAVAAQALVEGKMDDARRAVCVADYAVAVAHLLEAQSIISSALETLAGPRAEALIASLDSAIADEQRFDRERRLGAV